MSKRVDPALLLTLLITTGLIVGGISLLSRLSPGLIPGSAGQSNSAGDSRWESTRGSTQLTILGDTFSGYSTFRHSTFQDALKETGLTLNYEDEFDQAARAERLNQGEADLIVTTLDQFLQQQPQGQIVGLIDRTVGADAVVLNTKQYPNLKSLLDLNQLVQQARSQGKRLGIAFAGDTPSEYLSLVLDTKFEAFNLSDFEVIRVADASEAWELMQAPAGSSEVDVAIAVIWEPYVTQARQQGYTVVLSSQDAPGAIVDVLVASDRLIQSQPGLLSELLEAYYRRIDANVRDSAQLQAQIAEDGGLSSTDAVSVLQGIEFFTATESQAWFNDGTLERRIGSTAAVLALAGRLDQVPENSTALFSSEFITRAATNTQTLIELVRADNPELAERLAGRESAVRVATALENSQIQTAPDIGNLEVKGDVGFGVGSAQLTATGQQTLNQLAQEIQEFNTQTVAVRVIGHTSQTGAASLNQTLSQRRAQVVVDYLRNRGVQNNIVAEGKGFSQPLPGVAPTDARNQRTEIRLVRVN
ncbi:OmpA family protein [Oculatella sp. FACHB-28]|uniref:phosphate ABC transporter substrate-binding/OmpA family protein n=1 Tax=Oculatella sp. FACHB-28 TaxID=2692845 RepID=UPI001685EE2D|nr:phosphate ABC transporter substrate-binding/OmpA family protein [Oculatella sp. FACHB-28]MBD2059373.1 OmpA family protein [Oculatella sp. FACHB-28]